MEFCFKHKKYMNNFVSFYFVHIIPKVKLITYKEAIEKHYYNNYIDEDDFIFE